MANGRTRHDLQARAQRRWTTAVVWAVMAVAWLFISPGHPVVAVMWGIAALVHASIGLRSHLKARVAPESVENSVVPTSRV
jgi:hypothetical protein